jgi:hypothetical protein
MLECFYIFWNKYNDKSKMNDCKGKIKYFVKKKRQNGDNELTKFTGNFPISYHLAKDMKFSS